LLKNDSLLLRWDHPCLSDKLRKQLLRTVRQKAIHSAICTARPSFAPKDAPIDPSPYFPEAELGRDLINLTELPMIGWGGMQSLGVFVHQNASQFLKPQPVQTLAAIAMAFGLPEWDALTWAYQLWSRREGKGNHDLKGELNFEFRLPGEMEVVIFEDMENGLLAGKKAQSILEEQGYKIDLLRLWGITNNEEKAKVLRSYGANVVDSINNALAYEL
jgi:hypothetical protein